MAHVCEEWFPLTNDPKDKRRNAGFFMDDYLKQQIDYLLKNVTNDWDFTILISGGGEMRVGKSLIGMQICAYWTYELEKLYNIKVPFNIPENFVLNGNELIPKGIRLGEKYKYCSLLFDEAADDLESGKVLRATTQAIKDYLRKAAQYNMLNIIVQSEFFEVPRPIALSRSVCLIDVVYYIDDEGIFKRGSFKFYSRRKKKELYLKGRKELNYNCVKPDFIGSFTKFYPVSEEDYRKEKAESMKRWKKLTSQELRRIEWLRSCLKYMYQQGLSHREIAETIGSLGKFKINHTTIGRLLSNEKYEEDDEEESF